MRTYRPKYSDTIRFLVNGGYIWQIKQNKTKQSLFSRFLSTFKDPHQESQIDLTSNKHNYCLQTGLGLKKTALELWTSKKKHKVQNPNNRTMCHFVSEKVTSKKKIVYTVH